MIISNSLQHTCSGPSIPIRILEVGKGVHFAIIATSVVDAKCNLSPLWHEQASIEAEKSRVQRISFGAQTRIQKTVQHRQTKSRPKNTIKLFHCTVCHINYLDQQRYNHHINSRKNFLKSIYAKNPDRCVPFGWIAPSAENHLCHTQGRKHLIRIAENNRFT